MYDTAGNISQIVSSNGFKIDRTRPQSGSVSTGSNFQFDASSMEISWSGFSDSGSGIERFEYALGTWVRERGFACQCEFGYVRQFERSQP